MAINNNFHAKDYECLSTPIRSEIIWKQSSPSKETGDVSLRSRVAESSG